MEPQKKTNIILFLIGVVLFLAATVVADVSARISIGEEKFDKAIVDHLYYAAIQPVATALLLLPFVILSWMSIGVAKIRGLKGGFGFLILCGLITILMYSISYFDSQEFLKQKQWTAATLSVGLLPYKSAFALLIFALFRWFIVKNKNSHKQV